MIGAELLGDEAVFDHVGMVVASIAETVGKDAKIFFDPIQRVRVAFVNVSGLPLELIEPASDDSPVSRMLRTNQKLSHLCYRVPELAAAVAAARKNGFSTLSKPEPAVAFEGRRIQWIFHRTYGLVELVEAEIIPE